jgi:tripartite ATP-independent transporter DctP family solute receptor
MKYFLSLLIIVSFNTAFAKRVKFGTVAPAGTPWADTLEVLKKQVKKASKGKLKVKTYLGGQLGGELEIIQKIRRGNIQGGGLTSGALASVVPEIDVLELPYLFESTEEADWILDNHLYKPFKELFAKKDLVLVMWNENGWRHFGHGEKLIKKPADLVGQKMRSQESKVHLAMWKALGASPQAIATPEVLSALQTGVVNGFDNTPLFTLAAEWHTAIKNFTISGHIYQPAAIIYSKRFMDKLDDEMKKALIGDGNTQAPEFRVGVRALGGELISVLKGSGINVYELSNSEKQVFKDKLLPLHEKMVTSIGGEAKNIYEIIMKAKKLYKKQ